MVVFLNWGHLPFSLKFRLSSISLKTEVIFYFAKINWGRLPLPKFWSYCIPVRLLGQHSLENVGIWTFPGGGGGWRWWWCWVAGLTENKTKPASWGLVELDKTIINSGHQILLATPKGSAHTSLWDKSFSKELANWFLAASSFNIHSLN